MPGARSNRPRALRLLYCCKRLVQLPLLIKQMKGGKYSILQIISHTFHLRALLAVFILKFGIAEAGLGAFAEDGDDLLADRARVVLVDYNHIFIFAAVIFISLFLPFIQLRQKSVLGVLLCRHSQAACNLFRLALYIVLLDSNH